MSSQKSNKYQLDDPQMTGIDCQHDPDFLSEADEDSIWEQTKSIYD